MASRTGRGPTSSAERTGRARPTEVRQIGGNLDLPGGTPVWRHDRFNLDASSDFQRGWLPVIVNSNPDSSAKLASTPVAPRVRRRTSSKDRAGDAWALWRLTGSEASAAQFYASV